MLQKVNVLFVAKDLIREVILWVAMHVTSQHVWNAYRELMLNNNCFVLNVILEKLFKIMWKCRWHWRKCYCRECWCCFKHWRKCYCRKCWCCLKRSNNSWNSRFCQCCRKHFKQSPTKRYKRLPGQNSSGGAGWIIWNWNYWSECTWRNEPWRFIKFIGIMRFVQRYKILKEIGKFETHNIV